MIVRFSTCDILRNIGLIESEMSLKQDKKPLFQNANYSKLQPIKK